MSEAKKIKLDEKITLIPILADDLTGELPLIDVAIATIKEKKNISKLIISLNTQLSNPELVHLKRVRGDQILLFPCSNPEGVISNLKENNIDISLIDEDSIQIIKVAKIAPKIRRQFDSVNQLWPCNFHPNKYLEKLVTNTLFSSLDLANFRKIMTIALDICALSNTKSSAIIVDFDKSSSMKIVAFAFDQSLDNPNKHSVMVAIDNVAKTQGGGVWDKHGFDNAVVEMIRTKYGDDLLKFEAGGGDYLCTGYSAFLTREPCVTCAMALVHSRVKRVFYGARRDIGALGSSCKVHLVEGLNHHYEVFAGLMEEDCQKLM